MKTEQDVTGPNLKALRKQRGQTITDFWNEVFVKKSTGNYYETERSPMPDMVRRVCYLHFVCGLNVRMINPAAAAEKLEELGLNN